MKYIFTHKLLQSLYSDQKMSSSIIAQKYKCSESKVNYWLEKYNIEKRSISEAIDLKRNPTGDRFKCMEVKNLEDYFLLGLGLGLYWGEGNKKNKYAVRLGNTDPGIIKNFIKFLTKVYGVQISDLRFGIQVFNDVNADEALDFWRIQLNISEKQFYKTTITPSRGKGTYLNKSQYGVITVYFGSKKLRNIIIGEIEKLR